MLARLASRLTYANVIATIALFVALGGTAAAKVWITGADIRDRSITGADLANRSLSSKKLRLQSVTGATVRDGSLRAADFDPAALAALVGPAGAAGPAGSSGPKGDQGPKGDPGTSDLVRLSWTAPDAPGYVDGTPLVSQSVTVAGGWLVMAQLEATNTGGDDNFNCALSSGGTGFGGGGTWLPAAETAEIIAVGFGPANPGQNVEVACGGSGAGAFDVADISVSLVRLM